MKDFKSWDEESKCFSAACTSRTEYIFALERYGNARRLYICHFDKGALLQPWKNSKSSESSSYKLPHRVSCNQILGDRRMPVSLPEAPVIVRCETSVWLANIEDSRAHELHRCCIKVLELLLFRNLFELVWSWGKLCAPFLISPPVS